MYKFIESMASVIWGMPLLLIIIFTGLYLSIRTKFFQVTKAGHIAKSTFFAIFKDKRATRTKDKKSITQFQALSGALAASIGTGNIVGVAAAIITGGPGAIFWMWVSAFFR